MYENLSLAAVGFGLMVLLCSEEVNNPGAHGESLFSQVSQGIDPSGFPPLAFPDDNFNSLGLKPSPQTLLNEHVLTGPGDKEAHGERQGVP